jgi:hypothetical protein
MNRLLLLAFVSFVAGCASPANRDLPRDPVIVPEVVQIGVPEKCTVVLPEEPAWATESLKSTDPLERSRAVLIELEQHRDWWFNVVKPAIRKCQ